MVRPRRAKGQGPVWTAIHITEMFVIAPLVGVLVAVLIWG